MISFRALFPLLLASMATVAGSSLRSEPASTQWVGQFVVERSGERVAFVLVDRNGSRRQVQIPTEILASQNGVDALESRWVAVDARLGGDFPVALSLMPIPSDVDRWTHDALLLGKLPDRKILGQNKASYMGPISNVYEAIRAGRIARKSVQGIFNATTVDLGQRVSVARFYTDGDARHYFLVSPASLNHAGQVGVTIDEIREDNFLPATDQSGCLISNEVHRVPNPFGGQAWYAGQTFTTSAGGSVKILRSSSGSATVHIHPFGMGTSASAAPNVVTNTFDSGPGSLRNAITFCNANPTAYNNISFNIPKTDSGFAGPFFVINIKGDLPTITEAGLIIEGASQTAFTGDTNLYGPEVMIAGPGKADPLGLGLDIGAKNVAINSLTICGFLRCGIRGLQPGTSVTYCHLGIDPFGNTAFPNGYGIFLEGATGSNITKCAVSGNNLDGIQLYVSDDCSVTGSFVGVGPYKVSAVPNLKAGIRVLGCRNATVGHNVISGNTQAEGIHFETAYQSHIVGNIIGANPSVDAALPNLVGISLQSCDLVTVGGTAAGEGNSIAGNTNDGIVTGLGTSHITGPFHLSILGNRIGLASNGSGPIGNGVGLHVVGPMSLIVGDGTAAGRNVISQNGTGIHDASSGDSTYQGNYIGTNSDGSSSAGNGFGATLEGKGTACLFGGRMPALANVVSGNLGAGIAVYGKNVHVEGNLIGLDATGKKAVPNREGIWAVGALSQTTIGAAAYGSGNTICGNYSDGIAIRFCTGAIVQGNHIGIRSDGTAVANGGNGIHLIGLSSSNKIGGAAINEGNVISGNAFAGIFLDGTTVIQAISVPHPHVLTQPSANTIAGNIIGSDANGNPVPNQIGVSIRFGSHGNTIGGTLASAGNNISGNKTHGILVSDAGSSSNLIQANLIVHNGGNGVTIGGGASSNQVGTTQTNVIFSNALVGVRLSGSHTAHNSIEHNFFKQNAQGQILIDSGASSNTLLYNSIVSNAGPAAIVVKDTASTANNLRGNTYDVIGNRLLVDLIGNDGPLGVTPNDAKDLDTGPNTLQNNANINTATLKNGLLAVTGTLNSTPKSTFGVDIYAVTVENSAKHGGQASLINTFTVTTDASGLATFTKSIAMSGVPVAVCTQVTSVSGSSSEFGANYPVLVLF